jgi:glycosyltransferase involved in cell wall biosynthesis
MIIITYSETANDSIENRLGKAEYSYYFIYKKYLPALEKLGQLISVADPASEVDEIYRSHPDEACVFLSFSPPHRTVSGLSCPTVCVFAWEFDTIPTQAWGNRPEMNWASKLSSVGNALTLSQYAAEVTRKCLDGDINLEVIPAPLDTLPADKHVSRQNSSRTLSLSAKLYDSRSYNLAENLADNHASSTRNRDEIERWEDDEPIDLSFGESHPEETQLMVGFYSAEEWGAWSRTASPSILLPKLVSGPVIVELELIAYGANIGREIEITLGDSSGHIALSEKTQKYRIEMNPAEAADSLQFSNLDLSRAPGARDTRSLGIGLRCMRISRPDDYRKPRLERISRFMRNIFRAGGSGEDVENKVSNLELDGVAYTSVFNPDDGRKNWEDMVTAFCWAFRDEEQATLILKMSHNDLSTFLSPLLLLFSRLAPFKCRVVAIHGYLSSEELDALINTTDFVVNTSLCEGQCLPLMEFMGYGVPAISPDHTAMKDYVNANNSLVIQSGLQPTFWPFDERMALQTLRYRIDWSSLQAAFLESFDIARQNPDRYARMCEHSVTSVEETAGQTHVEELLRAYLERTARACKA